MGYPLETDVAMLPACVLVSFDDELVNAFDTPRRQQSFGAVVGLWPERTVLTPGACGWFYMNVQDGRGVDAQTYEKFWQHHPQAWVRATAPPVFPRAFVAQAFALWLETVVKARWPRPLAALARPWREDGVRLAESLQMTGLGWPFARAHDLRPTLAHALGDDSLAAARFNAWMAAHLLPHEADVDSALQLQAFFELMPA